MKKVSYFICKILLGYLLITLTGCPIGEHFGGDLTITIVNNSDKILWVYFDTDIVIDEEQISHYPLGVLKSNSRFKSEGWDYDIFKIDSIQHLFLFDKAVVDSVPWDTIRANYLILARIDFTSKMLDSLNWTLTYP
jgi:hypothetical protein